MNEDDHNIDIKLSREDIQAIHEFLTFTKKMSSGWHSYMFVGRTLGILVAIYLMIHDFWGAIAAMIHQFIFGSN